MNYDHNSIIVRSVPISMSILLSLCKIRKFRAYFSSTKRWKNHKFRRNTRGTLSSDSMSHLPVYILGVQISFEGFYGGPSFVNPSKLICTPNNFDSYAGTTLTQKKTFRGKRKVPFYSSDIFSISHFFLRPFILSAIFSWYQFLEYDMKSCYKNTSKIRKVSFIFRNLKKKTIKIIWILKNQ